MISKTIISVLGRDLQLEKRLVQELQEALGPESQYDVLGLKQSDELGTLILVDPHAPGLEDFLSRLNRKGRMVFELADLSVPASSAFKSGTIEDLVFYPFQLNDLQSKLRHFESLKVLAEVEDLNVSFTQTLERLKNDLDLAERLQKQKLPVRFPEMKGIRVFSRYPAGGRSGGDHFDLADSADHSRWMVVMTDSSTYGLSGALLSVLMKVAMRLQSDEVGSSAKTVERIQAELLSTLQEKDLLSIFYGVIHKKDWSLRYVSLGQVAAFRSEGGGACLLLPSQGGALSQAHPVKELVEQSVSLQAGDRLVLLSDGFTDALGGIPAAQKFLDEWRVREPVDLLNELAYRVKSKLENPDEDLPEQDCSALIFEVDPKLLRLHSSQ